MYKKKQFCAVVLFLIVGCGFLSLGSTMAAPVNDNFDQRAVLAGTNASAVIDFSGATREPDEPHHHGGFPSSRSLWWTWTAQQHGQVGLAAAGGFFTPIVVVYRGINVSSLTRLATSHPPFSSAPGGVVLFEVQAGETIQIAVDYPDIYYSEGLTGELRLTLTPPPENDAFAGRLPLGPVLPAIVAGNAVVATAEPGEPAPFAEAANRSLWWSWTSITNQRVVVTNLSGTYLYLGIFTGDVLSNLQGVVAAELPSGTTLLHQGRVAFEAQAGQTYHFRLDRPPSPLVYELSISVTAIAPPVNDDFTQRAVLEGTNLTIYADNVAALSEAGEARHFPVAMGKTLWWTWTPPGTGRLILDTYNAPNARMVIYKGTSIANLVRHTPAGIPNTAVIAQVIGGQPYQFVADVGGFPGKIEFQLSFEERTVNDDFANRKVITGSSISEPFRAVATSREAGEPKVISGSSNSLWWTWTAPANGWLMLDTDSALGVFTGDSLRTLRKLVAGYGRVSLRVRQGLIYQIAVDAPGSLTTRHLALNFYATPSNDSVAQPVVLTGTDLHFSGNTRGATGEGESRIHPRSRRAAIWYSWVAPADGQCLVGRVSSEFIPALAVYRKENSGALTRIAAGVGSEDSSSAGVTFPAQQGRTYLIGIDSLALPDEAEGGAFEFRLVFSTLRLLTPANEARALVTDPLTFSITAPLPEVDGALARVDYVQIYPDGGWLTLASVSNAPFSAVASNLPLGRAFYAAIAETDEGLMRFTPPHALTIRPANDDFSNRIVLTGYGWSTEGSTEGASVESGEAATGASVWHSWTAPSTGSVDLTFYFNHPLQRLVVFTGDALRGLKPVKLKRTGTFDWTFNAVGGQTYQLAVRDSAKILREDEGRAFSLHLKAVSFEITSPLDGVVLREPTDLPLSVRLAEEPASIVRVEYFAGTNIIGSSEAIPYSTTWSNAAPGAHSITARVVKSAGESPVSAPVSVAIRPRNDSFTNATLLTGIDTVAPQGTRGATREPGEPDHAGAQLQQSTWWRWVAPADGLLDLKVNQPTAPATLPLLVVYSGNVLSNLTTAPVGSFSGALPAPKEVTATVVSGQTYWIAVAETGGSDLEFALAFRPRPVNDRFDNRLQLAQAPTSFAGWTVLAQPQAGSPLPEGSRAVWWTWRSPSNGLARLLTARLPNTLFASVFVGDELGTLQQIPTFGAPLSFAPAFRTIPPRNGGTNPVPTIQTNVTAFNVRAGVDYHIAITDAVGGTLGFDVDLTFVNGPANDDFVAAQPLAGALVDFAVTNFNAGSEPGEPAHGSHSVWFEWTAPATGQLKISNLATNPAVTVAVYTGETLATAQRAPVVSTWVDHKVYAGQRYHFSITTQQGVFGSFPCRIELLPMASNDDFAERTVISGESISLTGTLPATQEFGEPAPVFYDFSPAIFGSLWWSWTAPRSGRTEVVFRGSRYGYAVGIFEGSSLGSLARVQSLHMNDGEVFDAVAGHTYQIAGYANHFSGAEFPGRLEMPQPPINDYFTNRTVLNGHQIAVTTTNFGGTVESGEPGFFSAPFGRTLWYSWQAPAAGLWVITNTNPQFPIIFRVFVGPDFAHLTNKIVAGTRAELPVSDGIFVEFSVDGFDGIAGVISFTIDFTPTAQPALFQSAAIPSSAALRLPFRGVSGARYLIEVSTNLFDWSPLETNQITDSIGIITEPEPGGWKARFYRIQRLVE